MDIYNGLKLAAGGELGIGVGEEDWGSGEREVLEGFIERTDGLVDLIVSRFGDAPRDEGIDLATIPRPSKPISASDEDSWLGEGRAQRASDGVIFSGIGAVTRPTVRSVSAWMEWVYRYGQNAYGVEDSPHSTRRRKRRKIGVPATRSTSAAGASNISQPDFQRQQAQAPTLNNSSSKPPTTLPSNSSTSIPPPIVRAVSRSLENATVVADRAQRDSRDNKKSRSISPANEEPSTSGTETLMKYLTLGIYGSSWGIAPHRPQNQRRVSELHKTDNKIDDKSEPVNQRSLQKVLQEAIPVSGDQKAVKDQDPSKGYFMIGLRGDLENEDVTDDETDGVETGTDREAKPERKDWNDRTLLRTLYVERVRSKDDESSKSSTNGQF